MANASYRGSFSRWAARNLPRQREEKDGVSPLVISLSDCSTSDERETPRVRAYRLAIEINSASTVMVSFRFIAVYFHFHVF